MVCHHISVFVWMDTQEMAQGNNAEVRQLEFNSDLQVVGNINKKILLDRSVVHFSVSFFSMQKWAEAMQRKTPAHQEVLILKTKASPVLRASQ